MVEFWKRLCREKPSVLRDMLPERYYGYIEQNHVYPCYEAVFLRFPNGYLAHVTFHIESSSDHAFTMELGTWIYNEHFFFSTRFPRPAVDAVGHHFNETGNALNLKKPDCQKLLYIIESLPPLHRECQCLPKVFAQTMEIV
ncbi:hypothetical protein GJ688_06105 [Heliobacillus mobilis]|uniref:Uncharacterized protein n=1 Tax=Heliobacterium mobile TaxID=28064 RepID=A0A6I3SI57_HELMO|nr:hypothetical protein [Heliobacterium mobile]MTV48554.1 hypothetical protein [Heliobacterium mobile]